jgi:hypothetical protein
MAVTVQRVLYSSQSAKIKTGSTEYLLPVQTASADTTIPTEDVLVMGQLGSAGREQKDVATCKASLKAFICEAVTVQSGGGTVAGIDTNLHTILTAIKADSLAGTPIEVWVGYKGDPVANATVGGFYLKGAASNISIDASKGAFPTLDLSFDGVGEVEFMSMGGDSAGKELNAADEYIKTANPVTSNQITVSGTTNDTLSTAKFAFDMPTETASRLGGVIVGKTSVVENDNVTFSKPPFKATLTVDGLNLTAAEASAIASPVTLNVLNIKSLAATITAAGAALTAKSQNQNVGDVGATYSVTIEGTDATFA